MILVMMENSDSEIEGAQPTDCRASARVNSVTSDYRVEVSALYQLFDKILMMTTIYSTRVQAPNLSSPSASSVYDDVALKL